MANNGGDLWDDSALLDAFDHAISKYKVMHGRTSRSNSSTVEGSHDAARATSSLTEASGPTDGSQSKENNIHCTSEDNFISHPDGTTLDEHQHVQGNLSGPESVNIDETPGATVNVDSEGYDSNGYHQLLFQYHELEKQRMEILQQLYQANSRNYQSPIPSLNHIANQVGHSNGSMEASSASMLSAPYSDCCFCRGELCTMCSYSSGCQRLYAPLNSGWSASQQTSKGGQQVSGNSHELGPTSVNSGAAFGMEKAERAMNSLNLASSPGWKTQDKDPMTENQEANGWMNSQNVLSEVDLSHVLGAWYSAGFYTGRYLEQSQRRGHG